MPEPFFSGPNRQPLSVSELTSQVKTLLEDVFYDVWVTGEISNYSPSKSGHVYFNLKDDQAVLPAVIWKGTALRLPFELKNGASVLCSGRLALYPPRGSYQLIIQNIEPVGIGPLELAFRQLHEKMALEGLFAPDRKKPFPAVLRRIAVVTSPTGAAVRDFLNILRSRSRRTDVLIVPVAVQGEGASQEIAQALDWLSARFSPNSPDEKARIDAAVLIRGGGSMEDLWAFNEERTVRAVASFRWPIATGIGHEIDTTLSDLAADLHALTPSDAAARLIPDDRQLKLKLDGYESRLAAGLDRTLLSARQRLELLRNRPIFQQPSERLFGSARQRIDDLDRRLDRGIDRMTERQKLSLAQSAARLEALSPLSVLSRGYSLTETASGRLVRSAADVSVGEMIQTRLAAGCLTSQITAVETEWGIGDAEQR